MGSSHSKTTTQENHFVDEYDFKLSVQQLVELNQSKSTGVLAEFNGVQGLCEALLTDGRQGLSDEISDFEQRKRVYGRNLYPKKKIDPFWKIFLGSLNDMILIVLIILSLISIALGVAFPDHEDERVYGWIDGFAILLAVFIVALVTSVNDWQKERKFRDLFHESTKFDLKVIRNGVSINLPIDDLLVGDVVELLEGDQIPADGFVLESLDLKSDESNMNGEPDHVKKDAKDPFLLSGCIVAEGAGKMLVTAVGRNSEWGRTLEVFEANDNESTPLEEKLDRVAKNIGKIGIFFGIITFLVLLIGFIIRKTEAVNSGLDVWSGHDAVSIVSFVVVGITVVVVAVPEGLPLAVTIALAFSVRKMMKDKNLVRHLSACETMGGATNICSDKTGTLTLNQMRVARGVFCGNMIYEKDMPRLIEIVPDAVRNEIIQLIILNGRANLVADSQDANKEFSVQGSKTEGALLILICKMMGVPVGFIRETRERIGVANKLTKMYTFSSNKKRMTCVVADDERGNQSTKRYKVYCKGASEIVLGLCSSYIDEHGETHLITSEKREEMLKHIESMATSGLRTLCLAYKSFVPTSHAQYLAETEVDADDTNNEEANASVVTPSEDDMWWVNDMPQEKVEEDMICAAIVGINDPLRPEVPKAVEQCKRSGIFVRMVTGDNILTAKHIARECGILDDDGIAIEGSKFRVMTDEEIDEILPRLQVMARSTPTDKFKLVARLKAKGEIVAVTGDGTNDGPALKEANVGLSMGISGTQVAKEASDIVIMDDNFDSIVKSVLWGRCIFENIQKFLQFQLTVNFCALFITVLAALTSFAIPGQPDATGKITNVYSPPLGVVQLLWVNLIMDTLAALALATEEPVQSLLDRPPNNRDTPLISKRMWISIMFQTLYQLVVLCLIYYGGVAMGLTNSDLQNRTLVFNTFVFCQIFNEWNARKVNFDYDIFTNIKGSYFIVVISLITTGGQALIVNFGAEFTKTTFIDWHHWVLSVAIGFLCIPIHFVLRFVCRSIITLYQRHKKNKSQQVEIKRELLNRDQAAIAEESKPLTSQTPNSPDKF
ncbi:calcium-transporting ATPase, plasma membrane-type [Acrasis kona]|uniref:P-type Ca(2+) transporter n=1 Tax=Acrasis kona TaxID=1008807 RepID=A0AAW2Z2N2_9EUKA